MKLSCVILFCDKDKQYIPRIIDSINNNVEFDHEIIFIDNRDDQSKVIDIDIEGVSVYSQNKGNIRQVEARRWSVQFCTGDYIWFIDVDDEVCPVLKSELEDIVAKNYDVYNFSYTDEKLLNIINFPEEGLYTELVSKDMWDKINVMNWNKWYKKTMFEKVISCIPEDTRITASEDILFTLLVLKYSETLYNKPIPVYKYNTHVSMVSQKGVKDIEQFKWITYGYKEASAILHKTLTLEEQGAFGLYNRELVDCAFFLNKYCETEGEELKKQILRHLRRLFSEQTIVSCIFYNMGTWQPVNVLYKTLIELNNFEKTKDR